MPGSTTGSKSFLSRTASALEDAFSDVEYSAKSRQPVYLSFDPSFIFPPLGLRDRMNINNPKDWLDIAAMQVFNNLDRYDPKVLGYQFVMPIPTFLTIKRNYETDIRLIKSLEEANTDDDMYRVIRSNLPAIMRGNINDLDEDSGPSSPPSSEEIDQYLTKFLSTSAKRHDRLNRLRNLVRGKYILTEKDVLSPDELRRSFVPASEFEELRSKIDAFRTTDKEHIVRRGERFTKAVEAYELLSNMRITQIFSGRYLFLGWPKARAFYPLPRKYHRTINSVFYRLVSLRETPEGEDQVRRANLFLSQHRDQVRFYHKLLMNSAISNDPLNKIPRLGIELVRDLHVHHLSGGAKEEMAELEKEQLERSFTGSRREVRDALANAYRKASESAMTLQELEAEFQLDEVSAGWEPLPKDHPIQQLLDRVKPSP